MHPRSPATGLARTVTFPDVKILAPRWSRLAVPALGLVVLAGALAGGALVAGGALGGAGTAGNEPVTPRFIEAAQAAGVEHAYDGEFEFFVGGGVAAFDCDDDGYPDLYLAGGSGRAALFRNATPAGGTLAFERLESSATGLEAVTGAYPLDVDGDGRTDLAVLRRGGNVLLRGLGDCRFERANEALGVHGGDAWTTAFSATWEPGASLPTLAFGNYLDESRSLPGNLCFDNELVRPRPDGTGYAPPIPLSPGWCTLSLLFSDWNRSGTPDLRVSNDRHYWHEYTGGQEQLWDVSGATPREYRAEDGWQRVMIWGMGIGAADLTGDGLPEYYLTSQGDNKLQTLVAGATGPTYEDIALRRGVTAHKPHAGGDRLPSTAWHPAFEDVNNDGRLDLFVTKGNVEAQADHAIRDPGNLLLGRPDGTFVERAVDAGLLSFARGRGAAVVDLDLDGLLDIVQVNRRENVSIWHNLGGGTAADPQPLGRWIAVRVRQAAPNVDAVGGWLEARAGDWRLVRELTVGGGHASGSLGWIHVGLGDRDRAEVRVVWPDGQAGPWLPVRADRFVVVERGATEVREWTPEG